MVFDRRATPHRTIVRAVRGQTSRHRASGADVQFGTARRDESRRAIVRRRLRHRRSVTVLCALIGSVLPPSIASADTLPGAPGCPILPPDSPWHQPVAGLPVARNSDTLIRSIGLGAHVHPGFGSGLFGGSPLGIPISVVSDRTPRIRIRISRQYARVSYRGRYPLSRRVRIQGAGKHPNDDRHAIVVNRDTCLDYELFGATRFPDGRWSAEAGVVFNLRLSQLRPPGWTSANAAGVPMLPGLVRYDEVRRGVIDHALLFTAPWTRGAWVYPARHYGQAYENPNLPPMGIRVRLKANVNISHLARPARIVAVAMKRYGMILTDNGGPWDIGGAPSPGWNNRAVLTLSRLTGKDFEVVNTRSLPHPGL